MKLTACLAVLCVCAFSSAHAQEAQSRAVQAPTGTPVPAPAPGVGPVAEVPPAAAPAPVAAAATTAAATPANIESAKAAPVKADTGQDKAATEAEIKTMRARGYKPQHRGGILVYCRSEGQIGTHFETQHCNTMDELKQAALNGKEYVNTIQQQGSPTPPKY